MVEKVKRHLVPYLPQCSMSNIDFNVSQLRYAEIMHYDWIKECTLIGPSNQSALFRH